MQKYVGSLSGTPSVSRPSTFEGSELLLSCLIRLSCILLVSRKKKVWEEDGIPKGLRDYQRWLYNARGSVVLETRTGEWAGGSELGEVKRREENQLFLSLRPIYVCRTSDSNVSQGLLNIKGSSLNNTVPFFLQFTAVRDHLTPYIFPKSDAFNGQHKQWGWRTLKLDLDQGVRASLASVRMWKGGLSKQFWAFRKRTEGKKKKEGVEWEEERWGTQLERKEREERK